MNEQEKRANDAHIEALKAAHATTLRLLAWYVARHGRGDSIYEPYDECLKHYSQASAHLATLSKPAAMQQSAKQEGSQ